MDPYFAALLRDIHFSKHIKVCLLGFLLALSTDVKLQLLTRIAVGIVVASIQETCGALCQSIESLPARSAAHGQHDDLNKSRQPAV